MKTLKLFLVFITAFSLASLPGALSNNVHLPSLSLAHATPAPTEKWYPGGPAMDTELAVIFTDQTAEFANIQSTTPSIDLTDEPLFPSLPASLIQSPNFYVTSAVSLHWYFDLQFMLANNYWGCNFNFGNSTCGVQIRQGIAHTIDRGIFAANDPAIAGVASAIDNPLPLNNGGLSSPNPCAWDANFTETGSGCVVGSPGGTAYHLSIAVGADGFVWLQAPGSLDLNAAAQHFVNAGLATGFNPSTSVLTGISSAAATHPVNFFVRIDDTARLDLGNSIAAQICYIFTGSYTTPCTYLTVTRGPITAFPGFRTSTTAISQSWWMYTGGFSDAYPFDANLYYTYNSKFVSGIPAIQPPNGPCSAQGLPSPSAPNYMYLCSPTFDSFSNQMEFASSLSSALSFGLQAEDQYGKGAYSIPVFALTNAQFAYLSNWQRVINGDGAGIPNFFTWLDAYSPNPAVAGTVRQGFSQTTTSVNPYFAETRHDFFIVGNIYDSLMVQNPLSSSQLIDWMILSVSNLPLQSLTYPPPPGTVSTMRFTVRNDLFFQDGRKVSSFDVAFTYLSMLANGAFQATDLSAISGITVLGPSQFDINLNGIGPFTLEYITAPTIVPARYWTNAGAGAWDSSIGTCTVMSAQCYPAQYTVGPRSPSGPPPIQCALTCTFPAANMNADPSRVTPTYDPIANHILIGSGPWTCGIVTSTSSGTCAIPNNIQNPSPAGGQYDLSRFGKGLAPASSLSSEYFRSAGTMALWTWSLDTGVITTDFLNYSILAACFGSISPNCSHWMMGIGGCGGTLTMPCTIGLQQIAIVNRFVGLNWVAPFNWQSSPPVGIGSFASIIYEGSYTLNPQSVAGCAVPFPSGGYDC